MGKQMKFGEGDKEKDPKFLGVTLDRGLAFQEHVKDVCDRVGSRRKLLFCLASKNGVGRKGI